MNRHRPAIDPRTSELYLPVGVRGAELRNDPMLNKGSAFPSSERAELGLRGVLPPAVATMGQQLERVHENYLRQPTDLARYLYLIALQDRNETLFYRLLHEHLEEMLPIVYTPTVGQACQRFSHVYRRPRGLFVTEADLPDMNGLLANGESRDVAVIVATDSEGILGIGDQGAGGMGISIGKLTLYTAAAGIHPSRCLPICLDVGTDNAALRDDPLYLGVRAPRLRGSRYLEVVDAFVAAVRHHFPGALLQWEDFSRQTAWTVLERHRDDTCSFNDDIQGTGAVVLAGILEACRVLGRPLADHRFCIHGAGAAGVGIAMAIVGALEDGGLARADALARVVALDSQGLLLRDRPGLEPYKQVLARERSLLLDWPLAHPGRVELADVVRGFRPTILVGTSGQPGCFGRDVVEQMARNCERPVVLALSNPTSQSEAVPADMLQWSAGRALVATGSPFPPVRMGERTVEIGQGNNVLCFPGIGLGVVASGARRVTSRMLRAASRSVAEHVTYEERAAGRLYPHVRRIREISVAVAVEVARAAIEEGVAPPLAGDLATLVRAEMWEPAYLPYRYVGP